MKYIERALKYYLSILILLVIILFALVKLNLANADLGTMFRNGYDSLWQIAAILAVFSAIYPKIGYGTRSITAPGPYSDFRNRIIEFMDERDYKLLKEDGEKMVFVLRSPIRRLFKMFEDNITITKEMVGFSIEGLTKDVVRVASGLENRLNPPVE